MRELRGIIIMAGLLSCTMQICHDLFLFHCALFESIKKTNLRNYSYLVIWHRWFNLSRTRSFEADAPRS